MNGEVSTIFKIDNETTCPCCGKRIYICRKFQAEEQEGKLKVLQPGQGQPVYVLVDRAES